MNSAVRFDFLSIDYKGQRVLDGLSLDVKEGEFLVLLGPSGCGKSTLLNAVAGLAETSGGRILMFDRDMTMVAPKDRNIGMVFQSYALYPTMSVEGNLSFGLRCAGMPKAQIGERVARAAQILRLEDLLDRKPAQLSGGQRQRVAIGRAIAREARILLFDEPLSNLDAKLRAELRVELKQLHRRLGSTIIYVTHDQVEAMTLADRVAVMNKGVIEQLGLPIDVYERPASLFVASFVGSPMMNFLNGCLTYDAGRIYFQGETARFLLDDYAFQHEPKAGHEVVLGIRPEHLKVETGGALTGRVELIERTGADLLYWIRVGDSLLSLRASTGAGTEPPHGDISFSPDLCRLSLFDRAGGSRL